MTKGFRNKKDLEAPTLLLREVYVYNQEGEIIDICDNRTICSEKYGLNITQIYGLSKRNIHFRNMYFSKLKLTPEVLFESIKDKNYIHTVKEKLKEDFLIVITDKEGNKVGAFSDLQTAFIICESLKKPIVQAILTGIEQPFQDFLISVKTY